MHTNKVPYTLLLYFAWAHQVLYSSYSTEHQKTVMDLDDDFGTEVEEYETVIDDE